MNAFNESVARSGRSIGTILIDSGILAPEAAEQVLRLQKSEGLRFGDAAIKLGLVTPEEIQRALSSQFDYAYLEAGDERIDPTIVAAFRPYAKVVEQMRALRSQLMLRWFGADRALPALAIVSPGAGEGRSFIAANLAIVFSQLGERTLLIDADMRNPSQHSLFRVTNPVGLSSFLAGMATMPEITTRIAGLKSLSLLPAGPVPPNPQELLGRPAFRDLLCTVRTLYDVILVDTSAMDRSADAQGVASCLGGALMVTRRNVTQSSRLIDSVATLRDAGTEVVGCVLNNG